MYYFFTLTSPSALSYVMEAQQNNLHLRDDWLGIKSASYEFISYSLNYIYPSPTSHDRHGAVYYLSMWFLQNEAVQTLDRQVFTIGDIFA